MNPIFTRSDLTKIKNIKIPSCTKINTKAQIDSVSDDESHENENCEMVLNINDIMKTIPNNAMTKPNIDMGKIYTEWRWRFFNVKGRKLIEISKKHPHNDRLYVDNTGGWIQYTNTNEWDKFLVNVMYHYVES